MINLAKDLCLVNAILFAMLKARFKNDILGHQNYIAVLNAAKGFEAVFNVVSLLHHFKCMKPVSFVFFFLMSLNSMGQRFPDHIYEASINGVKLFQLNNQFSQPIIQLNSGDQLELHFDDLSSYPKNYFYTYELCNADWTTANVSVFDYISGFNQIRISQYRIASVADMRYVHYQAQLPERNMVPTKSGNYLLKVFRDGDTSKLAFTRRLLVVDKMVNIGAQIQVPFDNELSRTHQKLQFSVDAKQLNLLSPQQLKIVVLQNNRWSDAITDKQPVFIKGNIMEYNGEQDFVFPAGKEYRWADLQSFRFESDRIAKVDRSGEPYEIFIKPDFPRNSFAYINFPDRNGYTEINCTEPVNPWWQSDYAWVHFSFVPTNHQPLQGKTVHLMGELTGNQISDSSLMQFNPVDGVYTKTLLLKQGYYSYTYGVKDNLDTAAPADLSFTDGNYWETENGYTILVYFRSLSGRHDELVGVTNIDSRLGRAF